MSRYQPFLLPLLDQLDLLPSPSNEFWPTSPMEEERRCQEITSQGKLLWQNLEDACQKQHGLPLLCAPPQRTTSIEPIPQCPTPPERILRLTSSQSSQLLMEHPAALPVADKQLRPSETIALARPSVFLQLWEQLQRPGIHQAVEESAPSTALQSDETTALYSFLHQLLQRFPEAADWHLEPVASGYHSRLRVLQNLQPLQDLTTERGQWLLRACLAAAQLDHLPPTAHADAAFSIPPPFPDSANQPTEVRLSVVPSVHGQAMVLRFLHPRATPTVAGLGFDPATADQLTQCFHHREGLGLIAGPTGSGKSTTLHALLQLATADNRKVLAAEDPVEVGLPGVQQINIAPDRGLSFATALRAFLRQAPDCLMVGEIRDPETAAIAFQAARTGHRVLSTVHARDTAGVQQRFADLGQSPHDLPATCSFLLHQRMAADRCPQCATYVPLPATLTQWLKATSLPLPEALPSARGCPHCLQGETRRRPVATVAQFDPPDPTAHRLRLAAWQGVIQASLHPNALFRLLPPFPICQP